MKARIVSPTLTRHCLLWPVVILAAALLPMSAYGQGTAPDSRESRRGETLLTRHCGACHSVGRQGASPNAQAPVFRSLGRRYEIESLEEALGEGLVVGHPEMPEFRFEADDVGAIIAYLKVIQE